MGYGHSTYLAHHLIVLQDSPSDVDAVILPVGLRHVLVDVGVDSGHDGGWPRWVLDEIPLVEGAVFICHRLENDACTLQESQDT